MLTGHKWKMRVGMLMNDLEIQKNRSMEMSLAILAVAFCFLSLVIIAWRYGILTSAALILKDIIVSVRTMLHDAAAGLKDLWQHVLNQRQITR